VRCGTVEFLDGVSARVVNRMHLHELHTDTRYPMGLNLAQNDTERILRDAICARGLESALHFRHRVTGVVQDDDGVTLLVETPDGRKERDVPDLGELPLRHYQISPVDIVPEAPLRASLLVDPG